MTYSSIELAAIRAIRGQDEAAEIASAQVQRMPTLTSAVTALVPVRVTLKNGDTVDVTVAVRVAYSNPVATHRTPVTGIQGEDR